MANPKVVLDTKGIRDLLRDEPEKVERWLDGFAEDMVSRIKLSFGTSPAPLGLPPGVDTGALRASIRWQREGKAIRHIMDGVEYGIWLEEGTEKIGGAHPFMAPVFADAQKRIGDDAKDNLGLESL